jgi:hypothetical protein
MDSSANPKIGMVAMSSLNRFVRLLDAGQRRFHRPAPGAPPSKAPDTSAAGAASDCERAAIR